MTSLDIKGVDAQKLLLARQVEQIRKSGGKLRIFSQNSLLFVFADKKLISWLNLTRSTHISYSQRHYPAPKRDQCISQPEESILALQRVKEHC